MLLLFLRNCPGVAALFQYFSVSVNSDSQSGFITFASCIIARGIGVALFQFPPTPQASRLSFVSKCFSNKLSAELLNKGNTYLTPLGASNIYTLPALDITKSQNNNFSVKFIS